MADELELAETLGIPEVEEVQAEVDAEYDAWFRAEVRKAIKEADDPSAVWISNEEVSRRMEPLRNEWRRKIAEEEAPR